MLKEPGLKIRELAADRLEPNPWNPNRVSEPMFAKLRAYVEREGLVEPLVVRPKGERFEILGGFHRWKIAQELGWKTVPCVVVDLDDRRAKILSVNLNELKGEPVPSLMAELIHDLSHDISLDDLATQLPYDLADLRDLTELLHVPDGLELRLEAEAKAVEEERMQVMTFPLSPEQHEIVDGALVRARRIVGPSRSGALAHIAGEYMRLGVGGEHEANATGRGGQGGESA